MVLRCVSARLLKTRRGKYSITRPRRRVGGWEYDWAPNPLWSTPAGPNSTSLHLARTGWRIGLPLTRVSVFSDPGSCTPSVAAPADQELRASNPSRILRRRKVPYAAGFVGECQTEYWATIFASGQQLVVLQRRMPRPCLEDADRRFWILACRWFGGWQTSLLLVKPETVLRWRR